MHYLFHADIKSSVKNPLASNLFKNVLHFTEGRIVKSYRTSYGSSSYITYMYYGQTGNILRLGTEDGTGNRIAEYVYIYDDNGNRESEHNIVSDEYTTYVYDSVNQLKEENHYTNKGDQTPYRKGEYEYDLLGNLNQRTITINGSPTSLSFTYNDANEVTNTGYTFDDNGNLTSDGYRTYEYNASDQLILIKQGANTIAEYEYNALGMRNRKQTSSITERYYYSGNQLSYITNNSGQMRFFFTYDASGQRLNMVDYTGSAGTEKTYWYEYDVHGNVIALLDKDGSIVVTYKYDAWGNILTSTGTVNTVDGSQNLKDANPFKYSGYFYDPETYFYYLKARYYTPYLQRFLTRDAFVGINPYLYTGNNLVVRIDPNGNAWWNDAVNWVKKTVENAVKKIVEIVNPISEYTVNKLNEFNETLNNTIKKSKKKSKTKMYFKQSQTLEEIYGSPLPPLIEGMVTNVTRTHPSESDQKQYHFKQDVSNSLAVNNNWFNITVGLILPKPKADIGTEIITVNI